MGKKEIQMLEDRIGYSFKKKSLLEIALTHSSYANEQRKCKLACNERFEFLGDAVLELTVSEFLFRHYPEKPEGELTKLRAGMVCETALYACAKQISLGECLYLGKGEDMTGGRERASVVSDALEALIGAIYLDGGFASAKEFIDRFVLEDIEHKQLFFDSKTILQEIVQSDYKETLTYELVKEEGPDHNKRYDVVARIGEKIVGNGCGRTKKAAEMDAAYRSIIKIRERENNKSGDTSCI